MEATQCSGQGLPREAASRFPEPHVHIHTHPLALCDGGLKIVLALSSGLIKLSHSCRTFPEENHRQGRGKGVFQQTQCYCLLRFLYFIKGFILVILEQQLQSSRVKESIEKNHICCIQGPERKFLCIL